MYLVEKVGHVLGHGYAETKQIFSIISLRVQFSQLIHIVESYCASLTLNPGNVTGRSTFFPTGPLYSLFMFLLLPHVFPC